MFSKLLIIITNNIQCISLTISSKNNDLSLFFLGDWGKGGIKGDITTLDEMEKKNDKK